MRFVVIVLSVLLLALVGAVGILPGVVEAQAEHAIAAAFERSRDLRVEATINPVGLAMSRLDRLDVAGTDLMVRGLPIRRLAATLLGVDLDLRRLLLRGQLRVRRIRDGEARLVVSEEGLATYLARRRGLRTTHVRFGQGRVTISGEAPVVGLWVAASLEGTLVVADGALLLHADAISVRAVTLRGPVVDTLIANLNPILSSRDLGLPLRVSDVRVLPGQVVVVATP